MDLQYSDQNSTGCANLIGFYDVEWSTALIVVSHYSDAFVTAFLRPVEGAIEVA